MGKPQPKKEYKKNINMDVFRDYNIISNKYWTNHKDKTLSDMANNQQYLQSKYWNTHDFNLVNCAYYNEEKEKEYVEKREQYNKTHGSDFNERLPPTLKVREGILFDRTKEVPDAIKKFDERERNKKKRYQLRFELEKEYRDKDIYQSDVKEKMALGKYNGTKYLEEKNKGYDNITLHQTEDDVAYLSQFSRTNKKAGVWDQIQAGRLPGRPIEPGQLPVYQRENSIKNNEDIDHNENHEGIIHESNKIQRQGTENRFELNEEDQSNRISEPNQRPSSQPSNIQKHPEKDLHPTFPAAAQMTTNPPASYSSHTHSKRSSSHMMGGRGPVFDSYAPVEATRNNGNVGLGAQQMNFTQEIPRPPTGSSQASNFSKRSRLSRASSVLNSLSQKSSTKGFPAIGKGRNLYAPSINSKISGSRRS